MNSATNGDLAAWRARLRRTLASWRSVGVLQLPPGRAPIADPVEQAATAADERAAPAPAKLPAAEAVAATDVAVEAATEAATDVAIDVAVDAATAKVERSAPRPDRVAELRLLKDEVSNCTRCPELASHRRQTVFGVGNPAARLCFFGEAPGADEDRLGEPFVGEAGQLLNRIIGACNLRREDVYILNVLKCRPPQNRNPEPGEIQNCRPFYERQLALIRPEFICCLGAFAARTLLDTQQSVSQLRGRVHRYLDARVVVTYHPAYLLRKPDAKRATWDDMKMLMREMGAPIE